MKSKNTPKANDKIKELVKPQYSENSLMQEAEFLCGEHNSPCRRNNSVVEDDDILF